MNVHIVIGGACLSAAALVCAQASPAHGSPSKFRGDVPGDLIRAIRAQPRLRYTGVYTVEFGQGPKSKRHVEYITKDGPRYRIEFPPNSPFAGQIVVEDPNVRLHYRPLRNVIVQQPPRHGEAWEKVANLATDQRFHINTEPGGVIAGMKTDQLVVSDKFGNVLQRLFIEPNSGLIMKRQILDQAGKPLGYFEFTQVDLNADIDPAAFTIPQGTAKIVTPLDTLERISRKFGFTVRLLPSTTGFQLESAGAKKFAGIQGIVQTYLNKRVRLWVYELKAPIDPVRLRQQARKNQHFYSWHSNGETVILIGNISDRILERIATMMNSGTSTPSSKL